MFNYKINKNELISLLENKEMKMKETIYTDIDWNKTLTTGTTIYMIYVGREEWPMGLVIPKNILGYAEIKDETDNFVFIDENLKSALNL